MNNINLDTDDNEQWATLIGWPEVEDLPMMDLI